MHPLVSGLFAKPLVSPSHTEVTRQSFENQSSFELYFITMEVPHFMHRLDPVNCLAFRPFRPKGQTWRENNRNVEELKEEEEEEEGKQ